MTRYLFRHATILDAERGEYVPDRSVLVEGDRILRARSTFSGRVAGRAAVGPFEAIISIMKPPSLRA